MILNFVESEYAPLKRVILSESEFSRPKFGEDNFLSNESKEIIDPSLPGAISVNYPEIQEKWNKEKLSMKNLLESYNIEVLTPRKLTNFEKQIGEDSGNGYANFFTRDPIITIDKFIIEGNLRFPHRRGEILPIRDILLSEMKHSNVFYVGVPTPDNSCGYSSEIGPFLEGGDVLILGKNIYVGFSGLASNKLGIEWLDSLLQPFGFNVIPIKLHPDILHLDCAMSFLREGLMICCKEAFLNGIPSEFSSWDKIYVSLEEASLLKTNGLPINESTYITDSNFESLIEKIEKKKIKVEAIDYQISRLFGGSFRCSTQALLRKN